MGKLLGIDHGIKRIGVAISDASQLVARELCIIVRKSRAEDFAQLNRIVHEHRVEAIIVGLPLHDVTEGHYTQADTVRLWAKRFQDTTPLPILLWDEQLTSEDAKIIAQRQGRKIDKPIDDLAARLILQSYLDALRDGLAPPPSMQV